MVQVSSGYRSAPPPFDRQDADLLLRSSDKVEYRVYRPILTLASSVFETMLRLPQPTTDGVECREGIDVTEDSSTLETLLRVCYPIVDPDIRTIDLVRTVLEAATKYDMPAVIPFAKRALEDFIIEKPLHVYAIACRYGLEETASMAVIQIVEQRTVVDDVYVAELEDLPAGCYHRLWMYQRLPRKKTKPPKTRANFVFCSPINVSTEGGWTSWITSTTSEISDIPPPFNDSNADVVIISSDEVHFRVYKNIISLASPVLKEMLDAESASRGRTSSETHVEEVTEHVSSVLHVPENSGTLLRLLQLCYPSDTPEIDTVHASVLIPVLSATRKYRIEKATRILSQRWSELTTLSPFRSYSLAASYGWKEQAVSAAKLLLLRDYEQLRKTYVPEMEATSTGPYFRLLQYHKTCGKAAASLTSGELTWASDHLKDAVKCVPCNTPVRPSGFGGGKWIDEYLSITSGLLRQRPSGTVLATEPVLAAILRGASNCTYCKQRLKEILSFNEAFSRAVDDEVAKIDPEMLFQSCT